MSTVTRETDRAQVARDYLTWCHSSVYLCRDHSFSKLFSTNKVLDPGDPLAARPGVLA